MAAGGGSGGRSGVALGAAGAMLRRWPVPLLAAALLLVRLAAGSPGDRAHVFQSCLAKCVKINCTQSEGEAARCRAAEQSHKGRRPLSRSLCRCGDLGYQLTSTRQPGVASSLAACRHVNKMLY